MTTMTPGSTVLRRFFCLLLGSFLWSQSCRAGEFVAHEYQDQSGSHRYQVYLPDGFSRNAHWPVMLWLHGASERGTDGVKPVELGLGTVLKHRRQRFPFVVVFPQSEDRHAPILSGWDADSPDGERALKILDDAIARYELDTRQQVLSGWSMGGYGTIELALADPDRWTSVVTLAGGAPERDLSSLKSIPFWLFHGTEDAVVKPEESQTLAARLRDAGATVHLNLLEKTDHFLWQDVYRWDGLFSWMLQPQTEAVYQAPPALPEDSPILVSAGPFVPALEMPSAAYVRLGNRMLEAVSVSIPDSIPQDVLEGRLNNIWDRTSSSGRTFNVQFSHISYSGDVERAYVGAYKDDRVTLQFALSNVNLLIGRTDVTGRSHSAVAGPIRIVIGHREPVWLSVAVEPRVENRKLKLNLIKTRFEIPRNNWYVTSPRILSTRGFGMTSERVRSSLVSGLYSSRGRIEEQVRGLVPDLIEQFEEKLLTMQQPTLLDSAWPLPVYRPRIQFWPREVLADELGVTVLLGMSVAAYDPQTVGDQPRQSFVGELTEDLLSKSEDLVLGMSSEILTPLTSQLIHEDIAHIHLEDVTGSPFRSLYEREVMERVVPGLKELSPGWEIRHELLIKAPLRLEPAPLRASRVHEVDEAPPEEPGVPLQMVIQPAELITTIRRAPDAEWEHLATCKLKLQQQVRIDFRKPSFTKRQAKFGWAGNPAIQVTSDDDAIDAAALESEFSTGWSRWIAEQSERVVEVSDLAFGRTRLRMESAGWQPPQAYARFAPPGIQIGNVSEKNLNYQIRTHSSSWSETYQLPPGETHYFGGADELIYREVSPGSSEAETLFTLPAGSESEYGQMPGDRFPRLRLVE